MLKKNGARHHGWYRDKWRFILISALFGGVPTVVAASCLTLPGLEWLGVGGKTEQKKLGEGKCGEQLSSVTRQHQARALRKSDLKRGNAVRFPWGYNRVSLVAGAFHEVVPRGRESLACLLR